MTTPFGPILQKIKINQYANYCMHQYESSVAIDTKKCSGIFSNEALELGKPISTDQADGVIQVPVNFGLYALIVENNDFLEDFYIRVSSMSQDELNQKKQLFIKTACEQLALYEPLYFESKKDLIKNHLGKDYNAICSIQEQELQKLKDYKACPEQYGKARNSLLAGKDNTTLITLDGKEIAYPKECLDPPFEANQIHQINLDKAISLSDLPPLEDRLKETILPLLDSFGEAKSQFNKRHAIILVQSVLSEWNERSQGQPLPVDLASKVSKLADSPEFEKTIGTDPNLWASCLDQSPDLEPSL